jgi:hypothetical protein
MAIIQTPQVGNQSAYPKILPLSNILMVLINQHKFECRMITTMRINKVIGYTTRSFLVLNM